MIRVKLDNAAVLVGGDFQNALQFVKRQTGRRYDKRSKTWTVPTDIATFLPMCLLPVEVEYSDAPRWRAGDHITQYGNRYSQSEWAAMHEAESAARVAGGAIAEQTGPMRERLRHDLRQRLIAAGLQGQALEQAIALVGSTTPIEELEEAGRVKFSSPARRQALLDAEDWYWEEESRIMRLEDDAETAARERVYRERGEW